MYFDDNLKLFPELFLARGEGLRMKQVLRLEHESETSRPFWKFMTDKPTDWPPTDGQIGSSESFTTKNTIFWIIPFTTSDNLLNKRTENLYAVFVLIKRYIYISYGYFSAKF